MSSAALDRSFALDILLDLIAIPGKSGEEGRIAERIIHALREAGVPASAIDEDQAHRKSRHGGERGNLIVKLPGTMRAPRRLLMAHIDTVPLCVGCEPVVKGGFVVSRNPATALGGDNRAGAAVVLLAALTILKHKLPHPPLTLFWPVQEEVGLVGARHVTLSKLGKPQLCFNWDGGAPHVAVIGATGAEHLDITVEGLASHAGAHPEEGISAAVIAGKALADLDANGWHGLVQKGKQAGTSNVGALSGGEATNVVLNELRLTAEARSHNPAFRAKIVDAYRKAFEKAARMTRNASGRTGAVRIDVHHKYESFRLDEREPCVQAALAAVRGVGMTPETRIVNGGLDANWLTAHRLPTVTLGCGQQGIHTVEEQLHVESFLAACRVALLLATAAT
jgi:tripeptide aminopeptidase